MRYLLSPDEELRFLQKLTTDFALVPLVAPDLAQFHSILMPNESVPTAAATRDDGAEYIFWASDHGPIKRLADASDISDAVGRVRRKLNFDKGLDNSAIDLETTPIVSWSRPRWFDSNRRWMVPSRLGTTRAAKKTFEPDFVKLFASIESFLRRNGKVVNSWDISNSREETGLGFNTPKNTSSYNVTVWPEASLWLEAGIKIYHWDA